MCRIEFCRGAIARTGTSHSTGYGGDSVQPYRYSGKCETCGRVHTQLGESEWQLVPD